MAEELQIAKSMAEILHKLQHSGDNNDDVFDCDTDFDYRRTRFSAKASGKQVREELDFARLYAMKTELGVRRARDSGRDFKEVMTETDVKVSMELARILAGTVDPVLRGLREVVVIDEEEELCGVCQENIKIGEENRAIIGCNHKFHAYCIYKWLKHKNACPLCRFQPNI